MTPGPLARAGSVLGTQVFRWPAAVERALLISDLHVPSDGAGAFALLQAAAATARRERLPLFVLGDLFDSYVSAAQVRVGVWRDTAQLLRTNVAAGHAVAVLHGNRDFQLGGEFEAASGATVVPGALRVELGGAPTLLAHGDEFCVRDLPYQRAKKWLRHPLTRGLARRLPLRAALALAEKARAKSRNVIAAGDQGRFLPTAAAVASAFADGVSRLVFGHIHRRAHGQVGGGRYWVLPAFDGEGEGLLADAQGLRPVRVAADGAGALEPAPAGGPCPFPDAAPTRGA